MTTKETVLQYLEENKGELVSGGAIAAALGLTRAAVWKAVQSLAEDGYPITSVSKKGYLLEPESDILSVQSIRPFLKDPDFYPDIRVYEEVGSTNQVAKELANNGAPGGTVIIAEHQTAGRGRMGRSFYSPEARGIYLSAIFRLQDSVETSMLITSAAAVAVSRAVKSVTGLETQIKWVNDVYLEGKKLCGILTEASMNFESNTLDYLVVGIGINVSLCDLPEELRPVVTCLEEHLPGMRISRSELIGALLDELKAVILDLRDKTFLREYRERSFILGSEINVISAAATERATAIDIDEQGRLLVRMADGTERLLNSGEISIRKVE